MKLNFILLAIVIAFIICYCFSKKKIQEGQISAGPQTSGGLLNGYEDVLIGVSEDYKLFKFNNPKKEWQQLRGKSCCVVDLAYWNSTLLGVGRYDHRLYAWDKMGIQGGLWKLATNLPMEWMQSIGVWKNKLFSANQQSLFRWTGIADGKRVDPFKRGDGKNPAWVWCGAKPNVKSIKEYRNQLYIVDKKGRVEMLVEGSLNQQGKLDGLWKKIGQPTEGLVSICEWNDKLMGIGTDNRLYEWSDERQNWFAKTTKFKLISILSLSYDQYQSQFNKPKSPFSCADGFKLEHQDGKRCYRAEGEELDWWSAYNKCKDVDPGRKTTLAVISSKKENDFVKDLMQHPKWIGCADKDKEGEWKWPDGETLQKKGYSNWNQKEPNNAGENEHFCEQYESGLWNDMPANAKRPYVCSHTTSLRREAGGKGGGRKCTEHKDKKKNHLYWNSNKWPVTAKDKDDCKNRCENDPKCPQADYYETGKRCYLYADNGSAGARRPRMTGSTPGETYFKCNTEAFRGSMKEGYRLMEGGQNCNNAHEAYITSAVECGKAANELLSQGKLTNAHGKISARRASSQAPAGGKAYETNWAKNQFDRGCWIGSAKSGEPGGTYFNLNANIMASPPPTYPSICGGPGAAKTNATGYSLAARGKTCQGDGKTQITSADNCKKAAVALKASGIMPASTNPNNIQVGDWNSHQFRQKIAKGCFADMGNLKSNPMYYNTSTDARSGVDGQIYAQHPAVCKGGGAEKKTTSTTTKGYSLAARGKTCQGDGKTRITKREECLTAAKSLKASGVLKRIITASGTGTDQGNWNGGENGVPYTHNNWPMHPPGCFVAPGTDNHLYWNTMGGCSTGSYAGRCNASHQAVCGGGGAEKTSEASKSKPPPKKCLKFGIAGYTSIAGLRGDWVAMSPADLKANANELRAFYNANKGLPILVGDFTHNNCCIALKDGAVLFVDGKQVYASKPSSSVGHRRYCANGHVWKEGEILKFNLPTGRTGKGKVLPDLNGEVSASDGSAGSAPGCFSSGGAASAARTNNPTLFMRKGGLLGSLEGLGVCATTTTKADTIKRQAPYSASAPSVGVGDGKSLVFDNITIGARKERSAVFTIKKTAFITKIVFEHKGGRVMCHGSGSSNFGCSANVALIIGDNNRREILPNINVKGYKKTNHDSVKQAHWYTIDGVGRDSKTMTWELKTPQTFMPGDYRLWYNEDLTNWTEADNRGWATYKMTMTDEAGNTTKFKDQMLKDLHSGLCLGVEQKGNDAKSGDGGRVVLSWCQRSDDKMWSYDPDSMQLTNRIPGLCAVVQGASKAGNAQIVMGKCNQDNGVRHFYNKTNGSFYTESSQCFENHSASKQVPKKNLLPGSIVQNPCNGGKNQRFSVVAPPPAAPAFKSSSERNSAMLVGETPLTLKKNNLLRIINAERDYRLEFTITPTAKIPGWSEIFHVTTSDRDCCGIGDRMPGMWFYNNTTRLHIRSGGADGGNLGIDPPMELPLNKETTVVIELNGPFMTVKYYGGVTYQSTLARSTDRPYGKAKFYACSNWYNAAKATVKNVKWTNKTTTPLGKNSVTCNFNVGGTVNSIQYKGKDLKVYGDKADRNVVKTVVFDSDDKDPGKIIVDAQSGDDTDGCKTSGFLMSCRGDPANPWNDFTSNKTHWSAVGRGGRSFRDKSGFPCETVASNLSLNAKEGFRTRGFTWREGFAPGKKIWASTGQQSVKIEGGPRLSPEVSCPEDFQGVPLKITAWGNQHSNGTETLQTDGGVFNIFNKDVQKLKGAHKIRLRPKQPKNGRWFADPIKERKTDSQGTLYLKTHMNSQWVRISNDYRECFQDATNLFVTSGDLGSGGSGEQCSGGLQYILHPKGTLCPPKTQIKTKTECEKAVLSLGIGKTEADNYPWDKVLEAKSAAGCSWTDRDGGDGPATVKWNSWPNSAGAPTENYHPVCYSKPPSQAAFELLKTEGCHKCPTGTFSKEGSNECVVCTKNSTNPECREGGKDQTSGLVCPAGTSSTGAVVTAEGKPMNLGEEQSSGNNSSETLKDQCKAFNSGVICDPPCNNTHGRCVGGMCMCGGGYRGPTCDEAPKARIPTIEEWNAAFEANKDTKQAQEESNKPETVSYGYHEHTNMNKPFTDSLRELNKDVQELLVEARKQKEKKKKQRSFLPSEFLGWSNAIPGLLGKQYKGSAQPKPIDVGIAIDDRRKIHFRQRANGKDTKLASVKSSPQVISSDAGKITSGSAQDDLKGANSFKNPKTADYRGFNDDSYLKGPDKPIEKAG